MRVAFAHGMPIRSCSKTIVSTLYIAAALAFSCSSSHSGPPAEHTGQSCMTASQCYPNLDAAALHGTVTCLTQLTNGYCTHTCQTDADCCAVAGECLTGYKQVCASFESSGQMYCFLSCNAADIAMAPDAGTTDPTIYCQRFASANATCRSTGGGTANQKFCAP